MTLMVMWDIFLRMRLALRKAKLTFVRKHGEEMQQLMLLHHCSLRTTGRNWEIQQRQESSISKANSPALGPGADALEGGAHVAVAGADDKLGFPHAVVVLCVGGSLCGGQPDSETREGG